MAAEPVRSSPPRWRRWLLLALLAEAALLGGLVKDEVTRSGNETARLATVERLVEAGTFAIEGTRFETVDRVRIGGRYYADKPLLQSVVLAGVYWPLHRVLGWSFAEQRQAAILAVTFFGVTLWSVLLSGLFAVRLRRHGFADTTALVLGLAVVLTTGLLSFGTTINNHTPAAALLFAAVVALERALAAPGVRWPCAAGLLVGALTAIDIPLGGVFALAGAGALVSGRADAERWRALVPYVAGGLAAAAVTVGINVLAYGHPLPTYLVPGAYDFPGTIRTGHWAGLHRPDAVLPNAFHQLLGERGVFSYQPVLLLALPWLLRWRKLPVLERWSAAAVVVLVAYYAVSTGDFGGWAYGFRYFLPLVPLLFWWAVQWSWEQRRAWRLAFAGLCAVGLTSSAVGALNPWPVVYEGTATRAGAVEHHVRSPILANLLVASFDRGGPDSALFRRLAAHHGPRVTAGYLQKAAINLRREDLLRAATAWARQTGVATRPASAPAAAPAGDRGARAAPAGSTPAPRSTPRGR